MDIFAHSLWTNAVFYKKYKEDKKNLFLSVLFGILPDLVSFSPLFIYGFISRQGFPGIFGDNPLANYAHESYNYTHSIVIFIAVFLVVTAIRRWKVYWPMFGWALHICIDIFTHKGFYETPFLFPLSGFRFEYGISWGHPVFMAINYSCLVLVYTVIFYFSRKSARKPKDFPINSN